MLVFSSDHDHLVNGKFEIFRMPFSLVGAVECSRADGYQAIWITGDMTFEFGSKKNLAKLLDYEYALELVFAEYPALSGVRQLSSRHLARPRRLSWSLRPQSRITSTSADRRPELSPTQLENMLGSLRRASAC